VEGNVGAAQQTETGQEVALERIIFFSDAVIAIVITLMVLDIRIPDGLPSADLPQALLDLWPKYLSYALSFLVVGVYWIEHQRMFKYVRRYDGHLIWLNFLLLMFIAFIPFSSNLLGEYGDEPIAVRVYAGLMIAIGMMKWVMWRYATHNHRLVDASLSERVIRTSSILGLTAPAVFLASIRISFLSSTRAMFFWWTVGPLLAFAHRIRGQH
jgi:uncharacterized membrane protein